jgi:large subunit ribosomal protein L25
MKISFEVAAEFRDDEGKGASRRLRRSGPAVLYGGKRDPRNLSLDHTKLMTIVEDEKFYSTIINLKVGDVTQAAIVKDVQMHPARNAVVHLDFQRVVETEKIRIRLPVHFKGQAAAPGVKTQGGLVSHRISDVEVICLPKDLPEFLELDMSSMALNDSKYIADIPLPPNVQLSLLVAGKNSVVVTIHAPRAEEPEPVAEAAATATAAPVAGAPAAGAPAAAGAAPAAAAGKDAKKEAGKKEAGKK